MNRELKEYLYSLVGSKLTYEDKTKILMYFDKLHQENTRLKHKRKRLNNIINELKWKPIEEYDKGNYDWVLVKYFDGDYECVPCVAEKRFGKWYSIDEKEIQFDVKYFMDMQQIDKLQELKGSKPHDTRKKIGSEGNE